MSETYEFIDTENTVSKNSVLKLEEADWYISYAPDPWMGDGPETALKWIAEDGSSRWYILKGDWRTEYIEAFPDLEACKKVFLDNKEEHLCDWSVE